MRSTEAGLILGTAGYMSPEQAAGKPVDRRADIWSFGVVLHELITGKRLFDGETTSHTLANVLNCVINLNEIPPGPIRELIRRCLDRNLKTRLQHIGEARIAIENFAENPPTVSQASSSHWPWAVAAAFFITAVALGWITWRKKPSEPLAPIILEVTPPEGGRFTARGGSAISPDGRTLAFVAGTARGESLLYLRPLESIRARALPGTEGAARPFWSPDSKSLAFVAGGKLKRIDVAGGTPLTLCDTLEGRGGTWSEDGVILFGTLGSVLQRIPASGGTPVPVTKLTEAGGLQSHYYPQFLPGGRQFLYWARDADMEKRGIFIGSLDGEPPARIVQTDYEAAYDPGSRRMLYIQGNGALMARRLKLDPPRLTGEPTIVAEGIGLANSFGGANFSVSAVGTLFYWRGASGEKSKFAWRDRSGKILETIGQPLQFLFNPSISLDQGRVAYTSIAGVQFDIWILDRARGLSARFTFNGARSPLWSPRGTHLYYVATGGIFRKAADGSGEEELVLKHTGLTLSGISADGRYLLYNSKNDIFKLSLTGEGKPEPYLQTNHGENSASFSPDGRWVAYQSNESGRYEIYVQGFPERPSKWLVSADGGESPAWRADGKELYWRSPAGMLMAASIDLQTAAVRPGKPESLFHLPGGAYDPARDGRRFLTLEPEAAAQPDPPMVVVQNWAARLGK